MAVGAQRLRQRWEAAQEAELRYWRTYRSIPTYQDFEPEPYWAERLDRLGIPAAAWQTLTVVEVGCGPTGMIFYLPPSRRKVGLDPLLGRLQVERPECVDLIRAVGEALPLRAGSADLVICQNVIDHVLNPHAVLDEIHRILRPAARLYLMAHTFPALLFPFLGFDTPHPHHWSSRQLLDLVGSHRFRIERQTREPTRFPVTWRGLVDPRTWKPAAANLIVSATFVSARQG